MQHKYQSNPVMTGFNQFLNNQLVTDVDRFLAVFIGHSHGLIISENVRDRFGYGHTILGAKNRTWPDF